MEIKYEVQSSFIHVHTGEKLYRVKVMCQSGGIFYSVMTEDEIDSLRESKL